MWCILWAVVSLKLWLHICFLGFYRRSYEKNVGSFGRCSRSCCGSHPNVLFGSSRISLLSSLVVLFPRTLKHNENTSGGPFRSDFSCCADRLSFLLVLDSHHTTLVQASFCNPVINFATSRSKRSQFNSEKLVRSIYHLRCSSMNLNEGKIRTIHL